MAKALKVAEIIGPTEPAALDVINVGSRGQPLAVQAMFAHRRRVALHHRKVGQEGGANLTPVVTITAFGDVATLPIIFRLFGLVSCPALGSVLGWFVRHGPMIATNRGCLSTRATILQHTLHRATSAKLRVKAL